MKKKQQAIINKALSEQIAIASTMGDIENIDYYSSIKASGLLVNDPSESFLNKLIVPKDTRNLTPLHLAVENGHDDAVELLLHYKNNPNARNNSGKSPLHVAACKFHTSDKDVKVIDQLTNAGANPNLRDGHKRTPLHDAANHLRPDLTAALLNAGADPSVRDEYGITPVDIAVRNDDYRSTNLLLNAGADADVDDRRTRNLENLYSNLSQDNASNIQLDKAMKFDEKYAEFVNSPNNENFEALTNSLDDNDDGLNYYDRLASSMGITHQEIKSEGDKEALLEFEETAKDLITTLQESEQHADKFRPALKKAAFSQANQGNKFLLETLDIKENITVGLEKFNLLESQDEAVSKELWNEVVEFTGSQDFRNLASLNKRTARIGIPEEQREDSKRKAAPTENDSEHSDRASKRLKTSPSQGKAISPDNIRKQQESASIER